MRIGLALACAVVLAGCGGYGLGEACRRDRSSDQGNCNDGLICQVGDQCASAIGNCSGYCIKLCTSDSQCPGAWKCNRYNTPENGGGMDCGP